LRLLSSQALQCTCGIEVIAMSQTHVEHHASLKDQAGELFHDLSDELKQEILDIRTGAQPVKHDADLIVRRHVMGIIILLFGLVALILLVAMAVIASYSHGHA
jgi:hypothetical protein